MMKHHLSDADLDEEAMSPIAEEDLLPGTAPAKQIAYWRRILAQGIAEAVDCHVLDATAFGFHRMTIVGRKEDSEAARYMFMSLANSIEEMAEKAWICEKSQAVSNGKRWKASFRIGAVATICQELRLGRVNDREELTESQAIVLVNRAEDVERHVRETMNIKPGSGPSGPKDDAVDWDALAKGRKAGCGMDPRSKRNGRLAPKQKALEPT